LKHCMVGYCKSQHDMPRWGQLGCSGFIVLDADKRVVSEATTPFLKMRGMAFVHVEALLDALLTGLTAPAVCPGQCVTLNSVSDSSFRGQRGIALDVPEEDGKCTVFLLRGVGGGSMVRVAADKLRVLPAIELSPAQLSRVEEARAIALATRQPPPPRGIW